MSLGLFILHEAASGYALFEVVEVTEVGVLKSDGGVKDLERFSKMVKMKAFQPFSSAENALENVMKISESLVSEDLESFLESNLPSGEEMRKEGLSLGVTAAGLGSAIKQKCGLPCVTNDTVLFLLRGARQHLSKYVKQLDNGGSEQAQLGLGHSYSRAKVKFNVNRQDNMIIQSIALLDQLDKDINTCAMRVKEWYSWHFPELPKIVSDSFIFARLVQFIGARRTLTDEKLEELKEITMDEDLANQVLEASKTSMGLDCSDIDMLNLSQFADRVVSLGKYRKDLHAYLLEKMSVVSPNLGALIGEPVAARLIAHAGSLVNLAKYPASTIQILGAEKALFRALKTKGNTPKYGLIFNSTFIGRAGAKNKGRISRYLANKCAMAARIDFFSEKPNSVYGSKLREQVEERLEFYETGSTPRKNLEVMREAATAASDAIEDNKPSKKRKRTDNDESDDEDDEDDDDEEEEEEEELEVIKKKKKVKKKEKKKKQKKLDSDESSSGSDDDLPRKSGKEEAKGEKVDDVDDDEEMDGEDEKSAKKKAKKKEKKAKKEKKRRKKSKN